MTGAPAPESSGFFGALFDFSFTYFVTAKLIKALYVLSMLAAGATALIVVGAGITRGGFFGLCLVVFVAPTVFLLSVLYARVGLEVLIVVFRGAEHLGEIARRQRPL